MTAKRKTSEKAPAAAGPASRKKGLEKVMYRLEPQQAQALRAEAFKRAQERGRGMPDASEVLRELIEAWMGRRSR